MCVRFFTETDSDRVDEKGQPIKMSYVEQNRKRTECLRMTSFIRLVDTLVANAMQNLVVESVAHLTSLFKTLQSQSLVTFPLVPGQEDLERKALETSCERFAAILPLTTSSAVVVRKRPIVRKVTVSVKKDAVQSSLLPPVFKVAFSFLPSL
jgi:hypothetical protein